MIINIKPKTTQELTVETIYFRNVCYAKPQNEIAFIFIYFESLQRFDIFEKLKEKVFFSFAPETKQNKGS